MPGLNAEQKEPEMLDLTLGENLLLIALWSWLNHHPAGTFQQFCNAYQRAKKRVLND